MGEPRDAATVILARRAGDDGYEILLTKRPESMAFMGGTYVFPGGVLDDADRSDALAACSALDRAGAPDLIGEDIEPERALGLLCCALRETFEEVGVLLARQGQRDVDPAQVREVFAPAHVEVGSDGVTFAGFLRREGLTLATDALVAHGRLITPESSPLRYDARFFVAPMPDGQAVMPDTTEVADWLWISPSDALERSAAGELDVPIPTRAILQGLAEVASYQALLAGRHRAREVEATQLTDLVTAVLAPNPGLATGAGTNTYIVGRGDVLIIDPAVPDPVYVERVAREVGARGLPSAILITHFHIDHIGGAAPLAEALGCDVLAPATSIDAPFVTRSLADGEEIGFGGGSLTALDTPGHAGDHLCYLLGAERALFAGDVVAGFGTVVIAPPDGSMLDYLATLHRLRELDIDRIYAGHGPVVENARAKLDEYIAHRVERERQVLAALGAGASAIPAMVERIYAEVPKDLHAMAERSVLAHLEKLEAEGRALRDGESWSIV